jgi:hypothetical protein
MARHSYCLQIELQIAGQGAPEEDVKKNYFWSQEWCCLTVAENLTEYSRKASREPWVYQHLDEKIITWVWAPLSPGYCKVITRRTRGNREDRENRGMRGWIDLVLLLVTKYIEIITELLCGFRTDQIS